MNNNILKARATYQLLEAEVESRRLRGLQKKVLKFKTKLSQIKKKPITVPRSVRKQDLMDSISFYKGEVANSKKFLRRLKR